MTHRIERATPSDLGTLFALYAESVTSPSLLGPDEARDAFLSSLEEAIADGRVRVAKSGRNIVGFAVTSRLIEDNLFPKSHSYRKTEEVLSRVRSGEEEVLLLQGIYVGLPHQGKGTGTELWHCLEATYRKSTWLCLLEEGNPAKAFFFHHGFRVDNGTDETEVGLAKPLLLYNRYEPFGLCREGRW